MKNSHPLSRASKRFFQAFRYGGQTLRLVWESDPRLTVALILLTAMVGLLPAAAAYLGKQIINAVVDAARTGDPAASSVWLFLAAEGVVVVCLAAGQRALSINQQLLRAKLGHRVNTMILEKSMTLSLEQFEDSEFYDKLVRAQREASSRPLSLVQRYLSLLQNTITLTSFAVLLIGFSPWAVLALALSALPAFIAEAKFSGDAFRLFRWRSPERRKQVYLETVIAREDFAKEVKLFGIAPRLLQRYQSLFHKLYLEDRKLALRRGGWSFTLGLLSTLGLYAAFAWVVLAAAENRITLGDMTMYLLLFRQGQSSVSASLTALGGMYEDNLYLSTLFEFLGHPPLRAAGERTEGERPGDGLRLEQATFRYAGTAHDAVDRVTLHIPDGSVTALVGANGSGKTTLIKLMTGLYASSSGCVLLDGTPTSAWKRDKLNRQISVIFQDFVKYQFTAGENIGVADPSHFEDSAAWQKAAERAAAAELIQSLPESYQTQLGRWFQKGVELSGGQWQKLALARALIKSKARFIILDEPTAALDARAEAEVFHQLRRMTRERGCSVVLVTHRLSNVQWADQVAVLDQGRIAELGSHSALLKRRGIYHELFQIQAQPFKRNEEHRSP